MQNTTPWPPGLSVPEYHWTFCQVYESQPRRPKGLMENMFAGLPQQPLLNFVLTIRTPLQSWKPGELAPA